MNYGVIELSLYYCYDRFCYYQHNYDFYNYKVSTPVLYDIHSYMGRLWVRGQGSQVAILKT